MEEVTVTPMLPSQIDIPAHVHKVGIISDQEKIWKWCCDNVELGTWGKIVSITGNSATYTFDKESDALMFALKWA